MLAPRLSVVASIPAKVFALKDLPHVVVDDTSPDFLPRLLLVGTRDIEPGSPT